MRRINTRTAIATMTALSILWGAGWAGTTAEASLVTLAPNADTFGQGGTSSGTNFGTNATLVAKAVTGDLNSSRKAYIRFDLSGLTLEAVPGATLGLDWRKFGTPTGTHTFNVYGLNNGTSGQDWIETTLTWDNAPRNNTGTTNTFLSGTTLLGNFSVNGGTAVDGTAVSFSSAALDAFLLADTDNKITLMLSRTAPLTNAQNSGFFSTDGASGSNLAPRLTVNVLSAPEPSTLVLAVLGLVGTVCCGRRRRNVRA